MSVLHEIARKPPIGMLRWPGSERGVLWLLTLLTLLISLLSIAPLSRLVWTAIAPDGVPDLDRLLHLVATPRVMRAAGNTLWIAFAATAVAVVLGTLAAWLVALTSLRAKQAWVFAFILPLMIPPQVTALAWLQALSPSGPIAMVLNQLGIPLAAGGHQPLYSASGIILLLGLHNAPLVFLSVRAGFRRLPADLVEAARITGASPLRVLLTVILPLARPAIFAGAALSFVAAAGNFGIQAMLGIPGRVPTLITLVYQQLNSTGPSALPDMAVLSLLIAAITVGGLLLSGYLGRRHDVRVTGTPRRLHQPQGRWRLPVEIFVWVATGLTLVLPLSALIATSLTAGFGQALNGQSLTLANYRNALFDFPAVRNAFFTSLGLTLLAVVILTLMSLFMAFFLTWQRTRLVRVLHLSGEANWLTPCRALSPASRPCCSSSSRCR